MELKILGCSGGKSIKSEPTCFLLDQNILIDAGAVLNNLSDESIIKLEHLIITHSHFDHIADLPFLLDKLLWIMESDFNIYSSEETYEVIFSSILNNKVWPNLIDIYKERDKKFIWNRYTNLQELKISDYIITPIRVNHVVPTDGLIIENRHLSFAFTADTFVTDRFWQYCKEKQNLKTIIAGVSFPNKMKDMAELTKHLTPELFYEEVKKMGRDNVLYYISHLKPLFKKEVISDLQKLPISDRITLLNDGDILELN